MLSGKQKRLLRAQANTLKAEVWVGKDGVTPGVLQTLENSFHTKELVKIKVLRQCAIHKKEIAHSLAEGVQADLVQILGNTIVLYRPLPESKGQNRREMSGSS